MRFLLKSCLPVGFGFLFLQGIAMALESLMVIIRPGSQDKGQG